jgi:hypothetical protein
VEPDRVVNTRDAAGLIEWARRRRPG